jgi:protein SCO1
LSEHDRPEGDTITLTCFRSRRGAQAGVRPYGALGVWQSGLKGWGTRLGGALLVLAAAAGDAADHIAEHSAGTPVTVLQTKVSTLQSVVPAVRLTRDDGTVVSLPKEMNDGRAVVLNFIFTSCSSTCPLMSQVFAEFERKLGTDRERVHLMSISIDPEQDTPARLREYAQKFHAGPEWQQYTGTVEASKAVQVAFAVYRGEKMNHFPVTLLRAAPGAPWRRIDGLITPDELLEEYRKALANR